MEMPTPPSIPFTTATTRSRQKLLGILFTVTALVFGLAQATFAGVLAGWDTHSLPGGANNFGSSPLAATVNDPNVTVGGLTRGSGVSTSGTGAARGWGGTAFTSTTAAAAETAGQYATFTITPNAGFQVSISGITQFNYRRSASGAATGLVQYQIGSGSFVDGPTVSYTSTSSSGAALTVPIDLSNIPALQNIPPNTTVTFRIVNYGGTSSSGTWYIFDVANSTANDFEISGTVASSGSTNPTAIASSDSSSVAPGQNVQLSVQVTPGSSPTSTGLAVTADLSQIGGSATQAFSAGANNTFTYTTTVPANAVYGSKTLSFSVQDSQGRTTSASLNLLVAGNLTIFHTNDTHARVTPHMWVIPQHSSNPTTQFEAVGGVAYLGAKMFSLVTDQPDALVLDGGDISEGNPVGDWNGPGNPTGSYGNGTAVGFFQLYAQKLKQIPGRGGRGLDAMVVGNHDIRDISYINNLKNQTDFPVISINICAKGTTTPYFQPYVIVNVNGHKVGIIGYTTESADSPEAAVNNLIDVKACDWSGTAGKIHFADYVNDLRNNQGCDIVILLTHDGHSDLCTVSGSGTSATTPILVDNSVAKVPEIAITGHWHTWAQTVWQPEILNYKTIFTESDCFTHYIGELRTTPSGKYISNANYVLRNADITPDPDIAQYVQTRKDQFNATNPPYTTDQVVGYSSSDLLLDNKMKWWSSDEYPWSGNNTAGNWICDAIQWKATALFGQCDLSIESGGGVRSDIPAGPVTYTQIYETYPWADDTIYVVNMTGAQITNYFQQHTCDVALSHDWQVTAYDGNPTQITYNGQPISPTATYKVAISNYMYLHDTVPFTDPSPQTSSYLARTALVEFTAQYGQGNPYNAGPSRYSLNTEFAGGFRAVVTMMNDADSSTTFDDGFIRLLTATPETVGHLGTTQVPTSLVNPDGSVNRANRLGEIEMYRSYLGFKTGVLKPGDIIETYGKGSFFGGDPEFVDQEGIQADGVEFKIVGHDDSLAQPSYFSSINGFYNQTYKNHYVKFFARKSGTNTVVDKEGTTITLQDVTAFSAYPNVPGNNGDLLVITGIPTSESFALRFRANSVALASSQGITDYPPDSHVNALTTDQTDPTLALTATATLAPGANQTFYTLLSAADATVSSLSPTTNTNSTTLFVASATTGFGDERTWLRFDLSSIPAGSTITSAKLNLFCWATAGNTIAADACPADSDTWTESTITWNTQPTFEAAADSQTLTAGTTNVLYTWDATNFVQTKFAGNQQASLVLKAQTEDMATASTYRFDSKEFGSNIPYLQVAVASSGTPATLTQVQFLYRFSTDDATWGSWTPYQTVTTAPYTTSFTYPNGPGYYEFYSVATDSTPNVEPAPAFADAAVHFVPSVTTAPTNVSNNGATVGGTYNPGGTDTTVYFQYGTDTNYGSTTASQDIGNGTSPVNFTAALDGLQGGTLYHVRAVTVTNGVTTYGADQTFTTQAQDVPTMPAWGWLALGSMLVMLSARQLSKRRKADLAEAA